MITTALIAFLLLTGFGVFLSGLARFIEIFRPPPPSLRRAGPTE